MARGSQIWSRQRSREKRSGLVLGFLFSNHEKKTGTQSCRFKNTIGKVLSHSHVFAPYRPISDDKNTKNCRTPKFARGKKPLSSNTVLFPLVTVPFFFLFFPSSLLFIKPFFQRLSSSIHLTLSVLVASWCQRCCLVLLRGRKQKPKKKSKKREPQFHMKIALFLFFFLCFLYFRVKFS